MPCNRILGLSILRLRRPSERAHFNGLVCLSVALYFQLCVNHVNAFILIVCAMDDIGLLEFRALRQPVPSCCRLLMIDKLRPLRIKIKGMSRYSCSTSSHIIKWKFGGIFPICTFHNFLPKVRKEPYSPARYIYCKELGYFFRQVSHSQRKHSS